MCSVKKKKYLNKFVMLDTSRISKFDFFFLLKSHIHVNTMPEINIKLQISIPVYVMNLNRVS